MVIRTIRVIQKTMLRSPSRLSRSRVLILLRVRVRSAEAVAEEEESSHGGQEEENSDKSLHSLALGEVGAVEDSLLDPDTSEISTLHSKLESLPTGREGNRGTVIAINDVLHVCHCTM